MLGLYLLLFIAIYVLFYVKYIRNLRDIILSSLVILVGANNAFPYEVIPINGVVFASIILLSYLSVILSLKKANLYLIFSQYNVLLVIFLLLMLVNINSLDLESYGWQKTLWLGLRAGIPLIALTFLAPFNHRDNKIIVISLALAGILTAIKLFILGDLSGERALVGSANPITIAREIGLAFTVLSIYYIVKSKNKQLSFNKKVIKLTLALFLLIALLFTGSRGPLIASIIAVLSAYNFVSYNKIKSLKNSLVSVSVIALAYFILNILSNKGLLHTSINRIFVKTQDIGDNTSDQGRLELFEVAWKGTLDSNFLGKGTGEFLSLYPSLTGASYPHNMILEILVEQGVLSMGIYILLLVLVFKQSLRIAKVKNNISYVFPYIFLYFFINTMVSGDLPYNSALWVFGGLVILTQNKKREEKTMHIQNQFTSFREERGYLG